MRLRRWISALPLRFRSLLQRGKAEQELDEELQFHLQRSAHQATLHGESPEEARREAMRALSGIDRCKEACREVRATTGIENLIKDFRYAARTLGRSPVFAATAAITLALGIGASTAMFTVINAVLLRPLPYASADRLVLLPWNSHSGAHEMLLYSNADFFDLRAGTTSIFDDVAGIAPFRAFVKAEDGSTEQINKALVTANFFRLTGAKIAFGRDFTERDAVPQPSQPGVLIPPGTAAILSYEYWQRRYGGDTKILGRATLDAGPNSPRIVGVLAPGFKLLFPPGSMIDQSPDVWTANNIGYDTAHRNLLTAAAIARLKSGITRDQAQQQFGALLPQILKSFFDPQMTIRLEPMLSYLVDEVRPALVALMGAVMFLLLIACANVANLMLVRASLRERELAMRAALGASRWRIVTQLFAEALLVSALGTLMGCGVAAIAVRGLVAIAPANVPRIDSAIIDWRVIAFAAVTGLVSVVIFALMPAIRASKPDVNEILRGGRTLESTGSRLLRNSVVIVEVALSFVLLIGSGLMFRSFLELRRVNPGYEPHGVLTFVVTREWPFTRQEGRLELLRATRQRLLALPGVENATAALILPLGGGGERLKNTNTAPAQPVLASAESADFQQVLPGYFETLHTRVLAGRTITEADNAARRDVAVVDDLLAARAFPHESAVGKRIALPGPNASAEVIGVVVHQRLFSLSDPGRETLYLTDGFWGIGVSRSWMLRVSGDPSKYAAAVRREITKVDRGFVVSKMRTMDALVDQDQANTRLSLLLIGTFAVIAVLLASVGLYGVLATLVRQRTTEIGVRMALGATPAGILRLVVGHGLQLAGIGLAIGILAAFALTRMMSALVFAIKPTDPTTFALITLLFLLVAAAASLIPAARASSLDASAALREE